MNIAAYCRVSSSRQAEKHTSIPDQLRAIQHYCDQRGYSLVRTFEDNGVTGTTVDRPAFQEMLKAAEASEFAAVIAYDISRWARTTEGTLVKERLRDAGLRVIFVAEGLGDSEDPYATELAEDVFASQAKAFSRKLSQIMPERMRSAVLGGKKGVGGRPPFGYLVQYLTSNEQPVIVAGKAQWVLVPDPDTAPLVLRAFELYANGASTRDVAAFLEPYRGRMKPTNVGRFLRNPKYIGANAIGLTERRKRGKKIITKNQDRSMWTIRHDMHEAIVSKELFEAVQARLDCIGLGKQRSRLQAPGNPFPQGMLRCATCGSVLEYHKSVNKHLAYAYGMCRNRRDLGAEHARPECRGTILFDDLVKAAFARIAYLLKGDNLALALANYQPKANPEIAALVGQLNKAKKARERLIQAIAEGGHIPSLVRALKTAEESFAEHERRLSALRAAEPRNVNPEKIRSDGRAIIHALNSLAVADAREGLNTMFAAIHVDLSAASSLRSAKRVLNSTDTRKKSKQAVSEGKIKAAETIDRILWQDQGPVYFTYRWERAWPTLHEKVDAIVGPPA